MRNPINGIVQWMSSLAQWIFGCTCIALCTLIVGSVLLGIGGVSQPFSANAIAGIVLLSISVLSVFLLYLGGRTLMRANQPLPVQENDDEEV